MEENILKKEVMENLKVANYLSSKIKGYIKEKRTDEILILMNEAYCCIFNAYTEMLSLARDEIKGTPKRKKLEKTVNSLAEMLNLRAKAEIEYYIDTKLEEE